jgi:DUF1365 family protein
MRNLIWDAEVYHRRHSPKNYFFKMKMFWLKLDLLNPEKAGATKDWFSWNKKNRLSFYDADHLNYGLPTAQENYKKFFKDNGILENINEMYIYTFPRLLNYVFNPLSIILASTESGQQCAILEVGNTFNELKPYFISPKNFIVKNRFHFETIKNYYISPFIDLDSKLIVDFSDNNSQLSVTISDWKHDQKILTAGLHAEAQEFSAHNIKKYFYKNPFLTFKVILMIHVHAMILYFKGLRYIKKADNPELQQGILKWKK